MKYRILILSKKGKQYTLYFLCYW